MSLMSFCSVENEQKPKVKLPKYDGSLDNLAREVQQSCEDVVFMDTFYKLEAYNTNEKIKMLRKLRRIYGRESTEEATQQNNNENNKKKGSFWQKVKEVLLKILKAIFNIIFFIPKMIIKFIKYIRDRKNNGKNKNIDEAISDGTKNIEKVGEEFVSGRISVPKGQDPKDTDEHRQREEQRKKENKEYEKTRRNQEIERDIIKRKYSELQAECDAYKKNVINNIERELKFIVTPFNYQQKGRTQCLNDLADWQKDINAEIDHKINFKIEKLKASITMANHSVPGSFEDNSYFERTAKLLEHRKTDIKQSVKNKFDIAINDFNNIEGFHGSFSETDIRKLKQDLLKGNYILTNFLKPSDGSVYVNDVLSVKKNEYGWVHTNIKQLTKYAEQKLINGFQECWLPIPEWGFGDVKILSFEVINAFKDALKHREEKKQRGEKIRAGMTADERGYQELGHASSKFNTSYDNRRDSISNSSLDTAAVTYVSMCEHIHMVKCHDFSSVTNINYFKQTFDIKKLQTLEKTIEDFQNKFKKDKDDIEKYLSEREKFESPNYNDLSDEARELAQYHKAMIQGAQKIVQNLQSDIKTMFAVIQKIELGDKAKNEN